MAAKSGPNHFFQIAEEKEDMSVRCEIVPLQAQIEVFMVEDILQRFRCIGKC